jgi:response regulator RpfG family c-di-GMP phosphodiesterase
MEAMTILVLEETESDLPHHQRILETIPGVRLALVADPSAAHKLSAENRFDLLVIDDGIADGGLAFLKQIHLVAGRRDVPVVLITAPGNKDVRRAAYEYGVYNVIEKPIDPATYLCVARNALSMVVMRRNDATAAAAVADQFNALQEQIEEREVQVIYSLLHAVNLVDEALSRRMARVASFAQKMAQRATVPHEDAKRLGVAARVYDIGMLAIAPNLRERRVELAGDDAARLLGAHTTRADEVFAKERSGLIDLAAVIARQHHERVDGRGYPDGLKGGSISVYAQMVGVAEVFTDAVTTGIGRSATPLSEPQALLYVERQTGTAFDPDVVEALRLVVTQPLRGATPGVPA